MRSVATSDVDRDETSSQTEPFLAGVKVLDFTQYLAGPSCTRLMAELGADVIKVEIGPSGDPTRTREPKRGGRSGLFIQQNRGKRSLCVDMSSPEAIGLLKDLVCNVDVVVENSTPGVMSRKGLGYDDLAAVNPAIIMASISGFGQTGPLSDRRSFDFIAQAMTGMMHMTGEPDGPPYFVGVGVADVNAGVHAFASIGYALFQRERTGRGTHVDIAMTDAMFTCTSSPCRHRRWPAIDRCRCVRAGTTSQPHRREASMGPTVGSWSWPPKLRSVGSGRPWAGQSSPTIRGSRRTRPASSIGMR